MRIVCPNCGAQYEVPDDVIPADGRDVECSSCGTTWYQHTPDPAGRAAALADRRSGRPDPAPKPGDRRRTGARAEADPEDAPDPVDDTGDETDAGPALPATADRPRATPRELDQSVASILREEAEFEARMRAGDDPGLESQGELGLDTAPPVRARSSAQEARERMARLRGAADSDEEDAPDGALPRGQQLPDVQQINQTLRPEADEPPRPEVQRRSGFRRGFALVVLVVALGVIAYVNAPAIAEAIPQARPVLNAYVDQVNLARIWLDAQLGAYLPR